MSRPAKRTANVKNEKLELVPFSEAPAQLRELLWTSGECEGTWGWYSALVETTLADDAGPFFAALRHGGAFVATVPLVRQANGNLRGLTALYTTKFAPAAHAPEDAERLGRLLADIVTGSLVLDALDGADVRTQALLRGIRHSGLATASYAHFGNWKEIVTDFGGYWESRSRRLRETVRRKMQRLDGRLSFARLQDPRSIGSALATYVEIHSASWKPPEPYPDFMPRMLTALADEGTAQLTLAKIDETAVAAQIWLVRNRRATLFKLAHRQEFEAHSPGTLLTHWSLAELCSRDGVSEVDLGRGDDAYKKVWLRERSTRLGLVAGNMMTARGLFYAVKDVLPTRVAALARRHGNPAEPKALS
jgi:CelD/BcsL family acetyltransferase involved in cellulose biosynthesis